MRDDRRHAGFDGAELFEGFSCEVARNFLSGTNVNPDDLVDAFVFLELPDLSLMIGTPRKSDQRSSERPCSNFVNALAKACRIKRRR